MTEHRTLLVLGAGGHGKSVAEAALLAGPWTRILFLDDRFPDIKKCLDWDLVGRIAHLPAFARLAQGAIAAVGNNQVRQQWGEAIQASGLPWVSVIHPRAWVSPRARLGPGVAVMAGAVVGTDACVGSGGLINAQATVDHDVVLGELAHLGVGVQLAGGVRVGERAWLHAGCACGYGVEVAADAVIPAGTALHA